MTEHDLDQRLDPFEQQLAQSWSTPSWQDRTVLVAVSGGPDSIALLRGLIALQPDRPRIRVAHFQHGLRGHAANADQQFVQQTCQTLNVSCEVGHAARDEYAAHQPGTGWESAARKLRYRFLIQAAERSGARYVATGHTADDQAETVLHHVLRGTGLSGLGGIPRVRRASEAVTIIRPLLSVSRSDVLAYLDRLHQPYRQDETNVDPRFTRNRLRHDLLPQIEQQLNPHVRQALIRLSRIAREAQGSFAACLNPLFDQYVQRRTGSGSIVVEVCCHSSLQALTAHLQRELFVTIWRQNRWPRRQMGFSRWQQLTHLLHNRSARPLTLPGAIRAEREDELLRLVGPLCRGASS